MSPVLSSSYTIWYTNTNAKAASNFVAKSDKSHFDDKPSLLNTLSLHIRKTNNATKAKPNNMVVNRLICFHLFFVTATVLPAAVNSQLSASRHADYTNTPN